MVAERPGVAAADTPDRTKLGRVHTPADHEDEMSDTDSDKPRRAADADGGLDRETPDAGDQGRPSRAWAPATDSAAPASTDAAPDAPEVSTPIPPPAPALPEPAQPPASGRRFSAEDLPEGWQSAAPRRSAVSVSSPFTPDEAPSAASDGENADADDDQTPETDPDAGGGSRPPLDTGSEAGVAPAPGDRRKMLTWLLGGIAAVVIIGLVIWLALQRPGSTAAPAASESATTSPSASASQAPELTDAELIAAAELGKLRKGVNWALQDQSASPGVPRQPACVELSAAGGGSPDSELNHLFTASKGGGSLLQVVQAWPDANSATTAFSALVTQAGSCEDSLLGSTQRVTGFADVATALSVQTSDGATHNLLFARTGRFVSVVDGAAPAKADSLAADALITASTASLGRQCGPASGACPSKKPAMIGTTPPVTDTVGWLAWVDLPRITAGAGKWTATDPQAPKLVGSQCENVDLNKLPGATSSAHRIYLLTNDARAPADGFGIDEVIYGFNKDSAASAMAKQLAKNFDGCGERTRTASVKSAGVKAPALDGKDLNATSYLVTQRISDSKTVNFRVGVAVVGDRLVYLLANPSGSFDFSDDAWKGIVGRATQRVTQFP